MVRAARIAFGNDVDEPAGELPFAAFAERELAAARPIDRQRVRLAIEPAVGAYLIRGDHVDSLALELVARVRRHVVCFGSEPHGERRARQSRDACQCVGGADERELHLGGAALDLLLGRIARPIVGDRRTADENLRAGDLVMNSCVHLLRRFDVDAPHGRRRRQRYRARHEHDLRACFARRNRDGETHLSRAAVGDVAHGVDRLARGPRRDDDLEALQRLHAQPTRLLEQRRGDLVGLEHAPRPRLAARLIARRGSQETHASRLE